MKKQPKPQKNKNKPIVDLVIKDMKARKKQGIKTYGTPLQAFNGRNALWDAYEEALDLAIYLKQALEELQSK
jgi:hypothetical protein